MAQFLTFSITEKKPMLRLITSNWHAIGSLQNTTKYWFQLNEPLYLALFLLKYLQVIGYIPRNTSYVRDDLNNSLHLVIQTAQCLWTQCKLGTAKLLSCAKYVCILYACLVVFSEHVAWTLNIQLQQDINYHNLHYYS